MLRQQIQQPIPLSYLKVENCSTPIKENLKQSTTQQCNEAWAAGNSSEEGESLDGKEVGFLKLALKGETLARVEDTEVSKGIIDSISWRVSLSLVQLCLHWKDPNILFVFSIGESELHDMTKE